MAVITERAPTYTPRARCFQEQDRSWVKKIKEKEKPQIPYLPDIPLPHERTVDKALVGVASHEFNHIYVALSLGVGVRGFSLIPEGNSLGRTELSAGSIQAFQIVAAAGAVDTCHGHAEGYGSDMFKVKVIHHYGEGMSPESARMAAAGEIASLDFDIRKRAVEIMAYMKTGNSFDVGQIIKRAEFEVRLEKGEKLSKVLEESSPIDRFLKEEPEIKDKDPEEKHTVISNLGEHQYNITETHPNGDKQVHVMCSICKEKDGAHNPLLHTEKREKKDIPLYTKTV